MTVKTIKVDRYEPDYNTNCVVCNNSPVVTMVRNDQVIYSTELCGICTWGESKALDHEEWNK